MLTYYKANDMLQELSGMKNQGTSCYLGLSKTEPKRDGTGVTEPDASNGYKRVLIGIGSQSGTYKMESAVEGTIKNKEIIYFPEATAAWGNCTHYVLFNSQTGGNPMAYGQLTSTISPSAGTVPLIRVGELQMTLT